jgi:hypothetical protein
LKQLAETKESAGEGASMLNMNKLLSQARRWCALIVIVRI